MAVQAKAGREDGLAAIETAAERRDALPPDIKLGWLSLWIGDSGGRTWLDVVAEVRESSFDVLAFKGPKIQLPDFGPFVAGRSVCDGGDR